MAVYQVEVIIDASDQDDVVALCYNIADRNIKSATSFTVKAYVQEDDGSWTGIGEDIRSRQRPHES